MNIRPMRPDEEPRVRALYRSAHRRWPDRPRLWFWAYPTLVLEVPDDQVLAGYASFSVGPDDLGLVLYGADVAVAPGFKRMGYGRMLADERLRYGRDAGCTRFLGATTRDNLPMQRIFEAQGLEALPLPVPHVFPLGEDAVLYAGAIQV